jgi:hypothetical protein
MKKRLSDLRNEMQLRMSSQGREVAYILTSFDEHQQHQPNDFIGRLEFISGFSGVGEVAVSS